MGEVSTIGLDIAKSVFQVHGVDGTGAVVMGKRINSMAFLPVRRQSWRPRFTRLVPAAYTPPLHFVRDALRISFSERSRTFCKSTTTWFRSRRKTKC